MQVLLARRAVYITQALVTVPVTLPSLLSSPATCVFIHDGKKWRRRLFVDGHGLQLSRAPLLLDRLHHIEHGERPAPALLRSSEAAARVTCGQRPL